MSGGKPATEAQLNEVLGIMDNLTTAVESLSGAVNHLLRVCQLQNKRLEALERRDAA